MHGHRRGAHAHQFGHRRVQGLCHARRKRAVSHRGAGSEGEKIRERGGEYGAVTGRPRRCGWFDVPAARYSARINHLDALIITKLDILDPLAEIPVGVEYEYKGKRFKDFPPEIDSLEQMKVHYRTVPGWQKPTYGATRSRQLPERAQDYLKVSG